MAETSLPHDSVDVLVSGGGIAGLIAAAAFGASGFKTLMVDPTPPVVTGHEASSDLRSTAFLRPARDLFAKIGIWEALAPHATPLEALRIVDTVSGETGPEIRTERQFEGRESANEPFGWNFLNWVIRRELARAVPDIANVELRYGVGYKTMRGARHPFRWCHGPRRARGRRRRAQFTGARSSRHRRQNHTLRPEITGLHRHP